jgi:hypothetical protein
VNNYTHTRIPFGRYRGQLLANIPVSYLRWVLREVRLTTPGLEEAIRARLDAEPRAWRPPWRRVEPSTPAGLPLALVDAWYRKLALKWHPHRGGSHEAMAAVNDAKELLVEMLTVEEDDS